MAHYRSLDLNKSPLEHLKEKVFTHKPRSLPKMKVGSVGET